MRGFRAEVLEGDLETVNSIDRFRKWGLGGCGV